MDKLKNDTLISFSEIEISHHQNPISFIEKTLEIIEDTNKNIILKHNIVKVSYKRDNNKLIYQECKGELVLTNYFLYLKFNQEMNTNISEDIRKHYFKVNYFNILKINFPVYIDNNKDYQGLEIITKDNRKIVFTHYCFDTSFIQKVNALHKDFHYSRDVFYKNIVDNSLSLITNLNNNYKNRIYDMLRSDYKRFTCFLTFKETSNQDFSICSSYPPLLYTPIKYQNSLEKICSYRTKNRLPVLCWYNKKYSTAILRSSQTKSSILSNRNEEDEKYLLQCRKDKQLIDIYDARPYLNAMANKVCT